MTFISLTLELVLRATMALGPPLTCRHALLPLTCPLIPCSLTATCLILGWVEVTPPPACAGVMRAPPFTHPPPPPHATPMEVPGGPGLLPGRRGCLHPHWPRGLSGEGAPPEPHDVLAHAVSCLLLSPPDSMGMGRSGTSDDAASALFSHFCLVGAFGGLSDPVLPTLRGVSGDAVIVYSYVKHVLGYIYVFFTVFGYWARGGGGANGIATQPAYAAFSAYTAQKSKFPKLFFDIVIT